MNRRKFVKLIATIIPLGLISSFIPVRLLAKLRVIQFKTVGTGDITKDNILEHLANCKAVLDEQDALENDRRYIRWMPFPEYNGKKWGEEI